MYSEKTTPQTKRLFWTQQVASWAASGLSKREFCRQHELVYSTFGYWSRKLMRKAEDFSVQSETADRTGSDLPASAVQCDLQSAAVPTESALHFLEIDPSLLSSADPEPAAVTLTAGDIRIDISPHASPALIRAVLQEAGL